MEDVWKDRDHNGVPKKWAVEPRTPAQISKLRAESKVHLDIIYGHIVDVFTCDDCTAAQTCSLAFDGYNTNGDCLLSK